jgi:hypothetical protein
MSTTIDYTELAKKGQEQFLASVRESQQAIVESVGAWSQTVQAYTQTAPTAPQIDRLPSPEQVIDSTFDLAEELIAGQREFAHNLLEASAPARQAPTSATTSATNPAANSTTNAVKSSAPRKSAPRKSAPRKSAPRKSAKRK